MTHSFLLFVIYAGCVFRLTRLVTADTITAPAREWLRAKSHEDQVRTVLDHGNERVETRVGEVPGLVLVIWRWATCSWCASAWIAAGCVVGWVYAASWFNLVAAVFDLSGAAALIAERS